MKALGNQLIVELYGCDKLLLNNTGHVEETMLKAAEAAKVTVVDHRFHKFSPHGVSGAVIVAESHMAVHTWPEFGYCAVDIFTCGPLTDNSAALLTIKKGFKAEYSSVSELKRGILDIAEEKIKHKPDMIVDHD